VTAGSTGLVALLGRPVAESLSPRLQNAAFAARGLEWRYVACEVEPDRLADAVQGLTALGFAGANVTIPHKQTVLGLCDELDAVAARAGSVNTLSFRANRVLGSSTDAEALGDRLPARAAPGSRRSRGEAPRSASSRGKATGLRTRQPPRWSSTRPRFATSCSFSRTAARP